MSIERTTTVERNEKGNDNVVRRTTAALSVSSAFASTEEIHILFIYFIPMHFLLFFSFFIKYM